MQSPIPQPTFVQPLSPEVVARQPLIASSILAGSSQSPDEAEVSSFPVQAESHFSFTELSLQAALSTQAEQFSLSPVHTESHSPTGQASLSPEPFYLALSPSEIPAGDPSLPLLSPVGEATGSIRGPPPLLAASFITDTSVIAAEESSASSGQQV